MSAAGNCCRLIDDLATSEESPFKRMVVTDYYDGPLAGLLECSRCGACFGFRMLDWDDLQNRRIYALSPTPASFDEICREVGLPVSVEQHTLIGAEDLAAAAALERALFGTTHARYVVATRDLRSVIDVWKRSSADEARDWFDMLGLSRNGPSA